MRVKKTHYPKIADDDVLIISTDIKKFIAKIKNKIKEKDKIINECAKILNRTRKEYQKLHTENIWYKDKLKQQLKHNQQKYERQVIEKEFYEKQRERDK